MTATDINLYVRSHLTALVFLYHTGHGIRSERENSCVGKEPPFVASRFDPPDCELLAVHAVSKVRHNGLNVLTD